MALHALLYNAQGAAATDLRGGQGAGHQEGTQTASGYHEVCVGGDLFGGVPADKQHDQQVDHHDGSDNRIEFHTVSPSH